MVESSAGDVPPNVTIYINNLNEKTKIDELKKSLAAVFSQFGKILEVLAFKTLKHKGQAWVVFEDVTSASNALRQMQGFPFYDKPMKIQYAKTKSDIIAKADGTFVPREKRKRHDDRADKKRRHQHDANQPSVNATYAGAYGATPLSQLPYPGGSKSSLPEAPAPPNNILFVQNLPHETTPVMLQMLFCQYSGFKEVRMVETKPGIAFVEYGDQMQSTVAMQSLQGFKITPQNAMLITYAKKQALRKKEKLFPLAFHVAACREWRRMFNLAREKDARRLISYAKRNAFFEGMHIQADLEFFAPAINGAVRNAVIS